MVLIYCDANIFIDYFWDRKDNLRPLKDFAFNFFSKGWNCEFELLVSDWLIKELENHLSKEQIDEIFDMYKKKDKFHIVREEKGDRDTANKYEHWDDALHAILAAKGGANFLTTRNIRHYAGCEKIIEIVLPEFI